MLGMDINMMSGISLPAAAPDASSNNMDTTGAKPPDMDMILDFLRKNGLKVPMVVSVHLYMIFFSVNLFCYL